MLANEGAGEEATVASYDESIDKALHLYIKRFCSLVEIYPLLLGTYERQCRKSAKTLNDFMDEHTRDDDLEVPPDKHMKYMALLKAFHGTEAVFSEANINSIVMLFGLHERLLSEVARQTLRHRPELARSNAKFLDYTSIISATSIEELRSLCIDNTVDTLMHDSHDSQITEVLALCGLKFEAPNTKLWTDFLEASQRRHLFVHTGGVVSRKYIKQCKTLGCLGAEIEVGTPLSVDHEYFTKSINSIAFVSLSCLFAVWRKHSSDQDLYEGVFLNVCVELLNSGLNDAVIAIHNFYTYKGYRWKNSEHEHSATLNLAQAYKWSGNEKLAKSTLDGFDTSSLSDQYKLAKLVLEDKHEEAADFMKDTATKAPSAEAFLSWPIFKAFRKTDAFKEVFEQKFGFKPTSIRFKVENIEPAQSGQPENAPDAEDESDT
jgi:hypothetical protein